MSTIVIRNIIRFLGIFLLQVLVLKRVDLTIGSFNFIHLIIYPYVILLLPFKTNRTLVLLIGFTLGLAVDFFYQSYGIHGAATLCISYMRMYLLNMLEPYEGYNNNDSPTIKNMGFGWFLPYVAILLLIHHFLYYSIEAFSFVYIFDIVMQTVFSFIPSLLLILLLLFLFKPKY